MNSEYELIGHEILLVEALRNFDFLRRFGYVGKGINLFGHERVVQFTNSEIDRELTITYEGQIDITIYRKKPKFFSFNRFNSGFSVFSLFKYFGENRMKDLQTKNLDEDGFLIHEKYGEVLAGYAEFIQERLLPIIFGTKWIDDIVDISELENLFKNLEKESQAILRM